MTPRYRNPPQRDQARRAQWARPLPALHPASARALVLTFVLTLVQPAGVGPAAAATPVHGIQVVAVYPHDPDAFTQGLVFHQGWLYESTGRYGASTLRRVALDTGRVAQRYRLDATLFGEGLTRWHDSLVMLTWRAGRGFIHDLASFAPRESFGYTGEGWGLTHDGRHWILSDGTAWLRFLDPQTRQLVKRVEVRDQGRPVRQLNELEFVEGAVWANLWYQDRIAIIDPVSGRVKAYVDLSALYPPAAGRPGDAVANGIAYDPGSQRLFVTGKNWPHLYEIRLLPPASGG